MVGQRPLEPSVMVRIHVRQQTNYNERKNNIKTSESLGCLSFIIWGFALAGYIQNIVHLIQCDFEPSYKAEILYGIGACTGLGALFGWFNFGV